MIIPIDFVAGTHGNFLEIALNHATGSVNVNFDPFTKLGTSHYKTSNYKKNKVFDAKHWFEYHYHSLKQFDKIISIRFSQDDLLLVNSLSLLRAGDCGIDNNNLEIDSVRKLDNQYYRDTILKKIYKAYPFLSQSDPNIPRYVLREFYKFGFADPKINGYWIKQQQMQYHDTANVFFWDLKNFYNWDLFQHGLTEIGKKFNIDTSHDSVKSLHDQFINQVPFLNHKAQCDKIITAVVNNQNVDIPNLSLFQESYINGNLEKIFNKEMPFYQEKYFNSTQDMLYYINNRAPNL